MEVRVMIGPNEATVTVANADEAVSFLAKLSQRLSGEASIGEQGMPLVNGASPKKKPDGAGLFDDATAGEGAIRQALLLMRGKPSGQVLQVLAKSENGCSDRALKREMPNSTTGAEVNLAPAVSHISKSCKKFGVDKTAVLHKQSKRGPKGKMSYFYQITDVAARLIREIPDFDKEPDWDGSEGFE